MQTLLITYVQICSRLNTFLSFSCWKTLYFRYCTEHLHGFQISIYCFFQIYAVFILHFCPWKSLSFGSFLPTDWCELSFWLLLLWRVQMPSEGVSATWPALRPNERLCSCRGWPQISSLVWKPETSIYILYLFACTWVSVALIVERI